MTGENKWFAREMFRNTTDILIRKSLRNALRENQTFIMSKNKSDLNPHRNFGPQIIKHYDKNLVFEYNTTFSMDLIITGTIAVLPVDINSHVKDFSLFGTGVNPNGYIHIEFDRIIEWFDKKYPNPLKPKTPFDCLVATRDHIAEYYFRFYKNYLDNYTNHAKTIEIAISKNQFDRYLLPGVFAKLSPPAETERL